MSVLTLALGWWVSVVLPVVLGLSVLGGVLLWCVRRASWRFQSWVFLGLLVAFALTVVAPFFPIPVVPVYAPLSPVVGDTGLYVGFEPALSESPAKESVGAGGGIWALIGVVWFVGALVVLWRLVNSQRALRRLVGEASLLEGVAFGEEVRHLLTRHKIEVFQTEVEVSPCCLGWVRRKVLVGRAILERLDGGERDLVLRHEIHHLTSWDVPLLYLQRIVGALYWWNPAVARINDGLSEAREGLCDEVLVDRGVERQAYAQLLVRLGELSSLRVASAVSGSPRCGGLKVRLERILQGESMSRQWAWFGLVAGVSVCAVALAGAVFLNGVVPKPALSGLQASDVPELRIGALIQGGSQVVLVNFMDSYFTLSEGETTEVVLPFEEPYQLSYLGYESGRVRLKWEGQRGDLVQELDWPATKGFRVEHPAGAPGTKFYDTPPVRPEDPLKEVDGDPSFADYDLKDRGGLEDGSGFGVADTRVASVNLVGSEPRPVWGTIMVSELPTLLDRFYGKPNPGNGRIRLNDSHSASFHEKAKKDRSRWNHDDTEFSRRHVERGLKEVQQRWPGQLLIEDRDLLE